MKLDLLSIQFKILCSLKSVGVIDCIDKIDLDEDEFMLWIFNEA